MTPTEQAADLWRRARMVRRALAGTAGSATLSARAEPAVVEEWARLAGVDIGRHPPAIDPVFNGGRPYRIVWAQWAPDRYPGPTITVQGVESMDSSALPCATPEEEAR